MKGILAKPKFSLRPNVRFCVSFMAPSENRHLKSVLTQIITFCVGVAFIVAKYAFLRQLEMLGENRYFKSVSRNQHL